MKNLILILTVVFAGASSFAAEKLFYKGTVYDMEGKTAKFTYERYGDMDGKKKLSRTVYKDMDGKVLVEEKMEEMDGKVVRYDIDQKQLKQKGWITVEGDKVTFNKKAFRKRNYPQESKLKDNFIMGLQIVDFVNKHWADFSKKKEKEIKLGVWHRQEMITFDLTTDSITKDRMTIKMSPSSMFIRAVVKPLYFTFDKKSKELVEYKGRTTPKEKRGRSYYDYDGLTKYERVGK